MKEGNSKLKELSQAEMENVSGGHCICHCSNKPAVEPPVSSMDECRDWCRTTGHGTATGCDGWQGITCNIL